MFFLTLFTISLIVLAYYVIDKDGASCLFILKYVSKTIRVGTSLLGLTESLIALKAECQEF